MTQEEIDKIMAEDKIRIENILKKRDSFSIFRPNPKIPRRELVILSPSVYKKFN